MTVGVIVILFFVCLVIFVHLVDNIMWMDVLQAYTDCNEWRRPSDFVEFKTCMYI